MKILNYELNRQPLILNIVVFATTILVLAPVIYSVAKAGCAEKESGFDASSFSCGYLNGKSSSFCPPDFPNLFNLCIAGFREGAELAQKGVASFNPAVFNQTHYVCNNFFKNQTQACYDSLNDQCWVGAETGFAWQNSAIRASAAASNDCNSAASNSAWAAVGLTLFAALVRTGMDLVRNNQNTVQKEDRPLLAH